jgi:hypothetical protein
MTEEKLQGEYRELVASDLRAPLLTQCFYAKLAHVASKHFGGRKPAADFLGVYRTTLSRWYCEGQALEIGQQLQSTIGRIAQSLLDDEIARRAEAAGAGETGNVALQTAGAKHTARHLVDMFDAGLVTAAVAHSNGRKGRAAKLLGVHRNWVVVHSKVRRLA